MMPRLAKRPAKFLEFALSLVPLVVGIGLLTIMGVFPILDWYAAQRWVPVPCTVVHSNLVEEGSESNPGYSVDIRYDYEWDGSMFHGEGFGLHRDSTADRERATAIVAEYATGSVQTCFVNPEQPSQSALNRSFNPSHSTAAAIGFFIVALSLGQLIRIWRELTRNSISDRGRLLPLAEWNATQDSDAVLLRGRRVARPTAGIPPSVAVIWNIVVAVALVNMYRQGYFSDNILAVALVSPFVLIGLLLCGALANRYLSFINPRPTLWLSPAAPSPGDTVALAWSFKGQPNRLRRLAIAVVGQEKATHGKGSSKTTETSTFAEFTVYESIDRAEILEGSVRFSLPEYTAPTFDAPHNKLAWHLRFRIEIQSWPNVDEEFPFLVSPLPLVGGAMLRPPEFLEI